MSTYDYVDGILFDFQEKLDKMRQVYFKDLFEDLEKSFNGVNDTLASNREEIKEMAYKTTMNMDGVSLVERPKDPAPLRDQAYSDEYDDE
jgi:hypothetical protein